MNAERILSQLLAGGARSGLAAGLVGGLASGLLSSRAGRKLGGKALELGGLAAIAGLAYTAWSRYQQTSAAPGTLDRAVPQEFERFLPGASRPEESESLAQVLLLAMIAAARADGNLDADERHAISARASRLDLTEAERAELLAALERPVDLDWLVAQGTTPERAAEIYAASLVAVGADSPAERGYLAMLEARLGLPAELASSLRSEAERVRAPGIATPA